LFITFFEHFERYVMRGFGDRDNALLVQGFKPFFCKNSFPPYPTCVPNSCAVTRNFIPVI